MTQSRPASSTPTRSRASAKPIASSAAGGAPRSLGWLFAIRSRAIRLFLAIGSPLVAALLTQQFSWALDRNIFMLFLIATTVTSLLAGWGYGIIGLGVGTAAFATMLAEPIWSIQIASPADRARVAAFMLVTALAVALCESLRRTSARVDQRERELHGGLTMLETLVNATPLAVITLDIDRRVQVWNESAERLFGWRADEVIGERYPLVPAQLEADHIELMTRMHRGSQAFSMQTRHLRKDGEEVDVTLWLAPLRDGAGRIVGSLRIAADARQQLTLEARLREAQKLEAIGSLAGGVAHDFNNMLTAILSSAELAMTELPEEHPAIADLREIRQAALRSADLTKQLLAFGRRQILQPQSLSFGSLIAELAPSLQHLVGPAITLVTDFEPELPATHADRSQLTRVMERLAENACEAMPDGGTVRITGRRWSSAGVPLAGGPAVAEGDYVLVTVADTGRGMDEQTISRLFEPFFTTKPFGRSAGLGLPMVYGIVRQSDGYVWATSTLGAGSEFHLLFPASGAEVARPVPVVGERRRTVLLADDEDAVRAVSARLLERAGYRVVAAASGEEALLEADAFENPPDLLVTDLVMPRMSGTRLSGLLRDRWPDLRVIYLSGFTAEEAEGYGLRKGESHFLSKPFDKEALLGLVAEVLEIPRAAA